jgi:chitinase
MTHLISILVAVSLAAPPEKPEPVVVGYVFGSYRDLNYRLCTHLCHAFLVADGEGVIRNGRNVPSRGLTSAAHASGSRVLLSLGGWGWDAQFAALVASQQAEDRYVSGVLSIVRDYDYDGIDLDWEYPDTSAEVVGFERMVRRFRAELDALSRIKGRKLLLTMAASSNPGTLRWLDTKFLLESMDWIHVMTYDYAGDWTDFAGHHSPLHASSRQPGNPRSTELTIDYLVGERKLPASRLVLGIPLYGRGFPVAEPYASTKGVEKSRLPEASYRNLARLATQGWTRRWDNETKNPWLISPDHKAVLGYDDVESVSIKARWAREKGLRGVFFWQVNADRMPDGTNPLQEAARKEWLGTPPRN